MAKSLSLKRKATPPSTTPVLPTALPATLPAEALPRPLGRGEAPVLALPRHVHDWEQRTAFARSVKGKSPLSPLPPGSPRTRSRLAAQRLENEFRRDGDDD